MFTTQYRARHGRHGSGDSRHSTRVTEHFNETAGFGSESCDGKLDPGPELGDQQQAGDHQSPAIPKTGLITQRVTTRTIVSTIVRPLTITLQSLAISVIPPMFLHR